jgi:hypothetical protein
MQRVKSASNLLLLAGRSKTTLLSPFLSDGALQYAPLHLLAEWASALRPCQRFDGADRLSCLARKTFPASWGWKEGSLNAVQQAHQRATSTSARAAALKRMQLRKKRAEARHRLPRPTTTDHVGEAVVPREAPAQASEVARLVQHPALVVTRDIEW